MASCDCDPGCDTSVLDLPWLLDSVLQISFKTLLLLLLLSLLQLQQLWRLL